MMDAPYYEEVVEAVAQALCESRYLAAVEWDRLRPAEQDEFRTDAKAAVAAVDRVLAGQIDKIMKGVFW